MVNRRIRCFLMLRSVTRWEMIFGFFPQSFALKKQNKKPALIPTDIFVVLFLAFSVRDRVAAVSMIYESRVVGCRELHQLSLCVSAAQRKENNQNIPHNRNVMCVYQHPRAISFVCTLSHGSAKHMNN